MVNEDVNEDGACLSNKCLFTLRFTDDQKVAIKEYRGRHEAIKSSDIFKQADKSN